MTASIKAWLGSASYKKMAYKTKNLVGSRLLLLAELEVFATLDHKLLLRLALLALEAKRDLLCGLRLLVFGAGGE